MPAISFKLLCAQYKSMIVHWILIMKWNMLIFSFGTNYFYSYSLELDIFELNKLVEMIDAHQRERSIVYPLIRGR